MICEARMYPKPCQHHRTLIQINPCFHRFHSRVIFPDCNSGVLSLMIWQACLFYLLPEIAQKQTKASTMTTTSMPEFTKGIHLFKVEKIPTVNPKGAMCRPYLSK